MGLQVDFAQTLASAILQGGFYALAAVGLSLIFGVQRILNVAHGAFIVLAAFVTIQFSLLITPALKLDPIYSLIVDFFLMGAFGGLVYFLLIYRIENSGFEAPLLATFGLSVFLEYVITNGLAFQFTIGFPINFRILPPLDPSGGIGAIAQNQPYTSGAIQVGNVVLQEPEMMALLLSLIVIPLLHFFLAKSYYGKAIRATAQDWAAAEFSGIDIRKTRLLCFVLGSSLAGVAGGLYSFSSSVTASAADVSLLPIILTVIILGGVGSMMGTLAGGLLVAIIFNFADAYGHVFLPAFSSSGFPQFITFLVFLVVLMIKPTGLFGRIDRV